MDIWFGTREGRNTFLTLYEVTSGHCVCRFSVWAVNSLCDRRISIWMLSKSLS